MSIGLLNGLKQQTPTTGSVATGQSYAQQIAGGMPFDQVVAPGLQFSPEAPMGRTQEELDFIAKGPAPVMPVAPTIGEPVAPSIPTMPSAPVGTPMPMPIEEKTPEFADFDFNFDFDFDDIFRDIDARDLAEIVEDVEVPSLFENNIPQEGPVMDSSLAMPSAPSIFDVQPISQPISQPMSPMNFTGLPEIPYMPPIVTPSALTQPRIDIDDIVSPIRSNKLMRTMPNLFNIV